MLNGGYYMEIFIAKEGMCNLGILFSHVFYFEERKGGECQACFLISRVRNRIVRAK